VYACNRNYYYGIKKDQVRGKEMFPLTNNNFLKIKDMETNRLIIIIIVISVIALIIFLIIRNNKDKKDLIKKLIEEDKLPIPKESDTEIDPTE